MILPGNYDHGSIGSDFRFSAGATVTSYKSNIDKLASNFFTNGIRDGNITYDQVGSPIGEFYGYKVIGYFSSAADVTNSPNAG